MNTKLHYLSDRPGLSLGMLFARDRGSSSFPFPESSFAYFLNGRTAIAQLVDVLHFAPGDSVLLPAYLDDVVVEPFIQRNIPIVFYKITQELSVDIEDVAKKMNEGVKAILVINYFGFPQEFTELRELCKKKNIFLIEDDAHGLLSVADGRPPGFLGDAAIFSIRKLIPSPEGGGLVIRGSLKGGTEKRLMSSNTPFTYAVAADLLWRNVQSRFNFSFLPISLITERLPGIFYPGSIGLPRLSRKIIDNTDFPAVINERRANFKKILEVLRGINGIELIYKELPDGVCPWGFPILVENREKIRRFFKKKGVSLPIHWLLPNTIPLAEFPISQYLSEHSLTLPVYQGIPAWKLDALLGMLKDVVAGK